MNDQKSNGLEVVPAPGNQLPAPRQVMPFVNVEALLEKAIDAKSAVEIIKELREMRAEDQALAAERAFDEALSAFQAECPVISKGRGVSDNSGKLAYSYAPLENIIQQVKPLLQKHGFHFTLDTDVESKDGWVIAKCVVTHSLGAKRTSTAKFPLGAGTRMMSTTQIYAAALTFASRRVFCNSFGIVTGGEDQDGQGDKPKAAGPSTLAGDTNTKELAAELWRLLPPIYAGKNKNWQIAKQFLVDENLITPEEHGGDVHAPVLSPARFREIIENTKKKIKP